MEPLRSNVWTVWCCILIEAVEGIWMLNVALGFFLHFAEYSTENHYSVVIMDTIASQITSITIIYSTVYSGADQRKYQSSASLAFVWGIHRWPVNSPHKCPVTRKMFPFNDVIMSFLRVWVVPVLIWHKRTTSQNQAWPFSVAQQLSTLLSSLHYSQRWI